jgi:hypothetical protein
MDGCVLNSIRIERVAACVAMLAESADRQLTFRAPMARFIDDCGGFLDAGWAAKPC